jgi:hypothetical protein
MRFSALNASEEVVLFFEDELEDEDFEEEEGEHVCGDVLMLLSISTGNSVTYSLLP